MDIFGKKWEGYEDKLVANWNAKVGADDLVLIAGDISWAMSFSDALRDLEWISALNGRKVLLRGNHDYWWKSITAMRAAFPPSVFAVQNDCLRFGKVLVAGTRGWTVPEIDAKQTEQDAKIFAREVERMKLTLSAAEQARVEGDVLIAMTHYPPFNARRQPSPFTELLGAARPNAVVYGHLHGAGGRKDKLVAIDGVPYYLTSVDQIDCDPVLIYDDGE